MGDPLSLSEESNDGASSALDWWAYVKHPDGLDEYVQVYQIENFSPDHLKDFEAGEKYVLRSSMWNEEKKTKRYRVFIIRLGETEEKLKKSLDKERARFPRLNPTDSDYLTSESELERRKKLPSNSDQSLSKKKCTANERDIESFENSMLLLKSPKEDQAYNPKPVKRANQNPASRLEKKPKKASHQVRKSTTEVNALAVEKSVVNQSKSYKPLQSTLQCSETVLESDQGISTDCKFSDDVTDTVTTDQADTNKTITLTSKENLEKDQIIKNLQKEIQLLKLQGKPSSSSNDEVISRLDRIEEKVRRIEEAILSKSSIADENVACWLEESVAFLH